MNDPNRLDDHQPINECALKFGEKGVDPLGAVDDLDRHRDRMGFIFAVAVVNVVAGTETELDREHGRSRKLQRPRLARQSPGTEAGRASGRRTVR